MKDSVESKLAQAALPYRMLQMLSEGGIHSTAELARRLGISEVLITAMAGDLARHGYLAPIESDCGKSCSGCWAHRSPGVGTSAVARGLGTAGRCGGTETTTLTLALTPKGHRASRRTR
jgi:hypothetical protein